MAYHLWCTLSAFRTDETGDDTPPCQHVASAQARQRATRHSRYPSAPRLHFIPCLLILKQPDLGTALVILISSFCVLWFVGLKKSTYAVLITGTLACIPVLWMFMMKPYQKMRILSLIDPGLDPSGYGYHAAQAKIAVGSGQLFGKGYLNGTQHKLHFIPEHHTDFIFTVFGEEWGLYRIDKSFSRSSSLSSIDASPFRKIPRTIWGRF